LPNYLVSFSNTNAEFTLKYVLHVLLALLPTWQALAQTPVEIEVGPAAAAAGAGRLLLFAEKVAPNAMAAPAAIDADPFERRNFAAAREVSGLRPGMRLQFVHDDKAYPTPIDQLPPGEYWMQALLDGDHSYAYSGRGSGDVVSKVVRVSVPPSGPPLTLTLDSVLPEVAQWDFPGMKRSWAAGEKALVESRINRFVFDSKLMHAFAGRSIKLKGYVLTPPGYDEDATRYPVVYFTHGYQAGMAALADTAIGLLRQTLAGSLPPMIWVLLDQSTTTGTHEFVDSVNNGPWGAALTQELLPDIDQHYRTDPRAGRFLMGHSSGGWAALWLQIRYPELFRGAWATSPDFLDFSSMGSLDLTDPRAVKNGLAMGRMEEVLGEYGGQDQSFEWVFSPRGSDGRPMRLYDRQSGAIDREVADYWLAHWDLSRIVRQHWPALKDQLDGKIHIYVGDRDPASWTSPCASSKKP